MKHIRSFKESKLSQLAGGMAVSAISMLPKISIAAPTPVTTIHVNVTDTVKIVAGRGEISVVREGDESATFKMFLFNRRGEMVRHELDSNKIQVDNLDHGEYQLNVIDQNNEKHTFTVKLEDF